MPPPPRSTAEEPGRAGLTTRAAVLGLVVCALVVSAALPLREYLGQRSEISAAEHAQAQQHRRVAELERERARLQDPAYIRAQARARLHFVLPGETAYVLLTPGGRPGAVPPGRRDRSDPGSAAPWYSQLWDSVRAADRPAA